MRKIRNPRYAPEFLERKLSPSAMISSLASVAAVSNTYPDMSPSIDVPVIPPPTPSNPTGPA